MANYKCGILPLSADPLTFGHLDLIRQASTRCDKLLIALTVNPGKDYVLKDEDRLKLTTNAIKDFCPDAHGKVIQSDDILTDIILRENCDVVFRGIRDNEDVEYESLQTACHEHVLPGITAMTVVLAADPALAFIRSTIVRNFAAKHLDISSMAPMAAQARLWRRMHQQKFIGITGDCYKVIESVAIDLKFALEADKLPTTIVDLTTLAADLAAEDSPGAKVLSAMVMATPCTEVDPLWKAHMSRVYRKALAPSKPAKPVQGIILVVAPHLVEDGMLHWVNNNVIHVSTVMKDAPDGIPHPEMTYYDRVTETQLRQQEDHYGTLVEYDYDLNTPPNFHKQVVELIRTGVI